MKNKIDKQELLETYLKRRLEYPNYNKDEMFTMLGKVYGVHKGTIRYKLKDMLIDKGKVIGVFGDTHIPFDHPNYLQFVVDTFKKYGVTDIVCTGDLVDNHAISRHESSQNAIGALDEYEQTKEGVKKYVDAFPKLVLCRGNHGWIPERQLASLGMPTEFLKSFHDLWGLPEEWVVKEAFVIDNVLYKHGIGCSGKNGAYNTAMKERMSTVVGHAHSFGGCQYMANHRSIIFGMNVGCGIDIDLYAFEYSKHAANRPTLGCGIVFNDSNAIFVPMGEEYFRKGKGE